MRNVAQPQIKTRRLNLFLGDCPVANNASLGNQLANRLRRKNACSAFLASRTRHLRKQPNFSVPQIGTGHSARLQMLLISEKCGPAAPSILFRFQNQRIPHKHSRSPGRLVRGRSSAIDLVPTHALPANSRFSVDTFTFSPSLMNRGTRISRPVSSRAVLVPPPDESPRTAGSV